LQKFGQKLNELKTGFQDRKAAIKGTNFDDFSRLYKSLLKKIPDISHLKNIVLFSGLSTLVIFILFAQRFANLNSYLPTKPADGGIYTEGITGEIRQLNPLYSPINNAETNVTTLIFSGLTKRIDERKIAPDLAESWEISDNKKTYTFHLKKDLKWHDGQPLTSDDVVFTFSKIQDPDAESPYLSTWKGVKVTATDVSTVVFELESPYVFFLGQTNVPIIPKHLLENIPSANLKSAEFSTKPVGSGPYIFEEFRELKNHQEVRLIVSDIYYGTKPHLAGVTIKAYKNHYEVIDAYKYRDVQAVERLTPGDIRNNSNLPNITPYVLSIPEYNSLVFNLRSGLTKDNELRGAINMAIDRGKIIEEVYDNWATPIKSAILPGFTGYDKKVKSSLNTKGAAKKLKEAGYVKNKDGLLIKDNKVASLRLVTVDSDSMVKEADLLAGMIRGLGFEISVEKYPFNSYIEDYVRTRNFDLLLVSQNMGADSDFYAYYHSNMSDDPGLNLSGIDSRELDKYIEEARTSDDPKVREARYRSISKILIAQNPAVYICRPNYIFGVSSEIKGIASLKLVEPKDKYSHIADWYIREIREY
jgi:peptide/nickel transport system substrate-binding protein